MPSRGRPVPLAVAALLVAAACGGDRVEMGGDPEADQALAAVQAAVAGAGNFRFELQGVDTTMAYWEEGPRQFTGEGAWSAGRWRLVTSDQNDADEMIVD